MKKSFISLGIAGTMLATALAFTGCGEPQSTTMSVNDIYAMSMVTGVNFLTENQPSSANQFSVNLTSESKQTILTYVDMFDNVLNNGGIHPVITDVTSEEQNFQDYSKKMSITLGQDTYTMYYNETVKGTEVEYDDNETETETESVLQGIVVLENSTFNVIGGRELETEEENGVTETETKVKLIISEEELKIPTNDEFDDIKFNAINSYVKIEQEIENNEIGYKYTTKLNGEEKSTSIGFENQRGKETLEIEIKENNNEIEYEIKKIENNKFKVEIENNYEDLDMFIEYIEGAWKFTNRNGEEL